MKIIAFSNQKGGVSKTTTCLHIGARLAILGYKTLLMDMDPQCDLSFGCGVRNVNYTILNFINDTGEFRVKNRAPNFFLLPGDQNLYATKDRYILKKRVKSLLGHFDFILLDCPPSSLNKNTVTITDIALCAATHLIVPIEAESYSVKNANTFIGNVFEIKKNYNPKLNFLGLFFSKILVTSSRKDKFKNTLDDVDPDLLFNTFIRTDTHIKNAVEKGLTIFQYKPNCRAAIDFINLTDEILKKINDE